MSESERLDRLEARAVIADLIHGYARSIRYDQPEDIAALFVPDGFFEIRDGHPSRPEYSVRSRLEGAAEIGEYLMAGKGKPHPVPVIRSGRRQRDIHRRHGRAGLRHRAQGLRRIP